MTSFDAAQDERGICIIKARGDIDIATAPKLEAAINAAIESTPKSVLLDLSNVEFLDSSGIRVLVEAQRRLDENGVGFAIDGMSPALTRVFEVSGVIDLLRHPDTH
jgi:anti-sigma B factor antagonist